MINVDELLLSKLENLAKLKLSQDEKENLTKELQSMIEMFSKISEVDTKNIAPLRHMSPNNNLWREDLPKPFENAEYLIGQAPKQSQGQISVPKVIE